MYSVLEEAFQLYWLLKGVHTLSMKLRTKKKKKNVFRNAWYIVKFGPDLNSPWPNRVGFKGQVTVVNM